jgi:chromate transporter
MELFRVFTWAGLQGFGGVLPVSQRVLVEQRRWLTQAEFVELMSIGQVLPGPNIINMALIFGDRYFGWRGAACGAGRADRRTAGRGADAGTGRRSTPRPPQVTGALRGMGMVAAGMTLSTALKATVTLRGNAMGLAVVRAAGGPDRGYGRRSASCVGPWRRRRWCSGQRPGAWPTGSSGHDGPANPGGTA